ncbi:MAG TPA: hypothetical protein VFG31_06730 [Conexibacter sp.]|nr:hypothetical protein [Conexibacter sp.]
MFVRPHRVVAVALAVAAALLAALAPAAFASSSISVGIPRKIGVQQPFTLTVTGFGDQAPLSRPDARFLVTVFGRNSGTPLDRQTCLNPPATAVGNPGVGFLLVSQYVPASAVNLTFPSFKMPQVGRWTLCAKISGYNVGGPNASALAFPAATVLVTQERVRLEATEVSVSLAPSSVAADGAGLSLATILATRGGQGLANRALTIQPDPDADAPRAVVCDTRGGGALLWPTHRFSDGTRSVTGFDARTDATGEKQLKLLTGAQSGSFSLSATLTGSASIFDLAQLTVSGGGAGQDPGALAERLTRAGRDFMEGASPRFAAAVGLRQGQHGSVLAREQALLEWLTTARAGGGGLNGLAFGPVRSADGRVGILVYPRSATVRTPSGAVTPGTGTGGSRMVIDVEALAQAIGASQTVGGIFRFPDLTFPQFAGVVQPLASWQGSSGPAVVGFATPSKNEDLAYFGYPEPPPLGTPSRRDFDGCLGLGLSDFVAEVHSPLRLTFTAADGRELGLAPGGPVLDIPGGFVSAPRGGVARYAVPAGAARSFRLLGTGSGRATVVLSGPRGGTPSVFSFAVQAGQSGTMRLGSSAPPSALTFGGKRMRATHGVGLRLKTPRTVGKGKRFGVVVKDQFGRAAAGVTVSASGALRTTDARGRATLKAPRRGGAVTVVASGGSFRKTSARVKLR